MYITNVFFKKSHRNFSLPQNIDYRVPSYSLMKGSGCNRNEWEENKEQKIDICLSGAAFKVALTTCITSANCCFEPALKTFK